MTLDRACRINEGGQSDKWDQICCCRPNPNGCMFCTGRIDGACEGEADVASRGGTENYRSACAVVQREFSANLSVAPSVMLVLGADKNEVEFGQQEIRLKKGDRNAFAQGVVKVAFGDLMHDRSVAMASGP
jgi:hypothetical protein